MERKIKIITGNTMAEAHLFTTVTADVIWNALPLESTCNLWGDEIYFTIPLSQNLEGNALVILEKGDLGYWPQGQAFCIFFGPTPISNGNEIRAASAVNVFGKITSDPAIFKNVPSNTPIRVEKVD